MESCRCCLAEVSDLFYVFSTLDEFNMKICELIANCGGILISEHDDHSKNICGSCLKDLTCAARFRDRCLKANYILQNKHSKIDDESVKSECEQLLQPQVIDLVESDDESVVCVDLEDEFEESITGLIRQRRRSKIKARIKLQIEYRNSKNDPQEKSSKHDQEYRPFACDDCGKAFAQKGNLIVHRRIHTGERPYKCSFCDKRFTQITGVTYHERIHTGERPERCKICKKTFIQHSHRDQHVRVHHMDKC